jgi:hypothetical protein
VTVRSTGQQPLLLVDDDALGAGLRAALVRLADGDGTVGVVVTERSRAAAEQVVAATLAADRRADVRVLDPRRAKGLEFDDLVVAAPESILAASDARRARPLRGTDARDPLADVVVTSRRPGILAVLADLDVASPS